MSVYADTSFLVSLLTQDIHTERARAIVSRGLTFRYSVWCRAEFCGAIHARARAMKAADAAIFLAAIDILDAWAERAGPVTPMHVDDFSRAEQLTRRRELKLRAPDALHLAVALRHRLELVTFDDGMASAAVALGMTVVQE